ncbi:MAG: hypothetical protein HOM96_03745 [Rickettsiales bacterium]|jgi:hypothetical protein|nr:hypothetical protein [Rickettsiales bacterium]
MLGLASKVLSLGEKIIERVIPDKNQAMKAKSELLKLYQEGELKVLNSQMSAILAEAKSQDKWTSRARPSFLYVIYIIILSAIPFGIVSVISPDVATAFQAGFKNWLDSIPKDVWTLFTLGYLGYAGARSYDKNKQIEVFREL